MKSSTAFIEVYCDHPQCRSVEKIELTTLANGGYDERNVDEALVSLGWTVENGQEICPEHKDEV